MLETIIEWEIKFTWDWALVDDKYFVLKENFAWAEDWDEVKIKDISENPNIPNFAVVKEIEEIKEVVDEAIEKEKIIKWYFREGQYWNWYISIVWKKWQVFVSKINTLWAKTWDKVSVTLWFIDWKPEALIKEILKTNTDTNLLNENFIEKQEHWVEILEIASLNWIRLEFPEEVLKESEEIDSNIESEIEKRNDLRNLFTITIDWPDSKDLDDAISFEILEDWKVKLYTHIADVTHFAKEKSHLDIEANKRWNSNYYADRVTPMYPERLSNDLCSLNPHTDKLAMTAEIVLDKYWNPLLEESSYYESVINTNFRMTYEEIDKIRDWELKLWDKLMFGWEVTKKLINLTKNSFNLSDKIWKFLKQNWELEINSTETKIVVDDEKNPIWIKAYPKHDSNNVIKNMMVITNNVVPQLVEKDMEKLWFTDFPFVFRSHWIPEEKAVKKLEDTLSVLWVNYDFPLNNPAWFSKLLDLIKDHPKEKFLTKRITITLQKAIYSAIKEGHFGLALEYYSHFTSPIRRYSDTQIHRIMKEIIHGTFTRERLEHYMDILPDIAEQCSVMESIAEKNESEVNKYLSFELMKDKIWETFSAYIDDIWTKKVKIILDNTISWIISPEYMADYYFDKLFEWVYKMKNLEEDSIIELWDKIEVELDYLDEEKKELHFKIK